MICPDCDQLRHPGQPCATARTITCPECDGGWIEHEYEVGGYSPDRWMEIRTKMIPCERCDGTSQILEEGEEDE